MILLRAAGLFALSAIAEILGCYLPYLWLRRGASALLLLPTALSLAAFVWLLSLQQPGFSSSSGPGGSARTYAAYGGVYIAIAILWLWLIEGERPTRWDLLGALVALCGMSIIVLGGSRRG